MKGFLELLRRPHQSQLETRVLPVRIHSLQKIRKSEFWPKYVDPREPSVGVERPYCPEAQTDWETLATWVVSNPEKAQEHIVRISGVSVCMAINNEEQGYREERWNGSVLIKRNKNNETGIALDPRTGFWYIATGTVTDEVSKEFFVALARYMPISQEKSLVLKNLLDSGNFGSDFSLRQDYMVDSAAQSIRLVEK